MLFLAPTLSLAQQQPALESSFGPPSPSPLSSPNLLLYKEGNRPQGKRTMELREGKNRGQILHWVMEQADQDWTLGPLTPSMILFSSLGAPPGRALECRPLPSHAGLSEATGGCCAEIPRIQRPHSGHGWGGRVGSPATGLL